MNLLTGTDQTAGGCCTLTCAGLAQLAAWLQFSKVRDRDGDCLACVARTQMRSQPHMRQWRLEQRVLSAMLRSADNAARHQGFVNPVPPQQTQCGYSIDRGHLSTQHFMSRKGQIPIVCESRELVRTILLSADTTDPTCRAR